MKLCDICHKNIATIFTAKIENGKPQIIGSCIECAKKMGLNLPLNEIMEANGINSEEMEIYKDQMNSILENIDLSKSTNNDMFLNIFNSLNNFSSENDIENSNNEIYPKEEVEKDKSNGEDSKSKNRIFKKKRNNLNKYGINLTEKAKNNKVDRVIGRNREIDRVIQILNRRNKNNPILIGEPGVGKTAIAEGLAVRIIEKQVPEKLFDVEVYLLDLTSVVAGTQFRGQFEARMKSIIDEAKENENIILVIDEVHNIIGAGEAQGGALNAANILKPALARGEIQVIGATTLEEYRKYIEKDSALERRFQPVLVEETSIEETIDILKGIRKYYEDYHKVTISDDVIEEAVKLSKRYINDRYLPDKAIDVIDEASSRANLKNKGLVEIKALKEELEKLQENIKEYSTSGNYEKAAESKVEECRLEEKIKKIEKDSRSVELTIDDIAFVIEAWTKIPVRKVKENEAERLLNLEERLHRRVIGQEEAVRSLARAIRRNRLGFKKKRKPSSFIFVGSTGIGKTELVKALSCELFGSEEGLIRVDMSEYMEKHTVSKLIGAPPGYIGYDEGGQLTEKVRRKPYSVILLDEIEKAHSDVFNMLLQILEDGKLTDNQGRTVYFDNTIVIMTSNAGTNFKGNKIGFGSESYSVLEGYVKDSLKEIFKPEFLNRVDEIIVFKPLKKEEIYKIIDLMLNELKEELWDKNINIKVLQEVKDFILKAGYDDKFGARPLRRAIQRYIEDEIAEQYFEKKVKEGSSLEIGMDKDKVIIKSI
ncbi:ATP-dependent Clp protease ATP-binding subunit ClpA [Clostridium tetanomorphum]|uniref:ATP-dependent Clp protease ATP-binding subunit n=1 Tax=Clostridium tetanomorphum TaxID=1553 RepID=A0A923EEC8_CLOTT|nr:ATP-dependent Clp protease ATP-binding subunit [Clostridium tetanomorphum]KAJ53038.1 negative regulator of genetic competence clpC/mecB [Clostridium tetanomorphum DSM 665]MBC2400171.1 ATP-dependent Clp protease ATP-binding subunit [Clostridium tetanomorphum]MBP1866577.1 ATP-dependent Clp protease ATP-binding subunit ClpA [Clostridium tetanomorphum]NRS86690.1 ATP-dependent Clp protease ATP-binding subunit ClpA [Clostridium tetanomorphum]NRZ99559.1 ATP-dependent Clp protease ATP-binding subun